MLTSCSGERPPNMTATRFFIPGYLVPWTGATMPHPNAARAVPILTPEVLSTVARASIPVDGRDPRGAEKLIDVRDLGVRGHNFYARPDSSNAFYDRPIQVAIPGLLLRESVARLVAQA